LALRILKDNRRKFLAEARRRESVGVQLAAQFLVKQAQGLVNTSAGPKKVRVKRRTARGNRRTRTIYTNPSRPGQSPHKRTGQGQRSIATEHDSASLTSRVGWRRSGRHMLILELFRQRPHLVKALNQNRARIAELAATGGWRR